MKSITITINTKNAAFDPDPFDEIYRILSEFVNKLNHATIANVLWDINGNRVGTVEVSE